MIKLIDRYVIKEMFLPTIIGTLSVALMFQANQLIALYKSFQLGAVPALAIFQYILYKTPEFLVYTLPVGTALAASLAAGRLSRESELVAMRIAGVSVRRVLVPVAFMGLMIGAFHFWMSERLLPIASAQARRLENDIGALSLAPVFKQNVFVNVQRYAANFGTVQRESNSTMVLSDILLIERRSLGESMLVIAKSGRYSKGNWVIEKPTTYLIKGASLVAAESTSNMTIYEPISVPQFFYSQPPAEQSIWDLKRAIDEGRKLKRDTSGIEVEFHNKFSIPAACFVFAIMSAITGIALARRGPFVGTLVSLLLALLYYNLFIVSTQIFAKNGWASPVVSAWLPNAVLLVFAIWMIRRQE